MGSVPSVKNVGEFMTENDSEPVQEEQAEGQNDEQGTEEQKMVPQNEVGRILAKEKRKYKAELAERDKAIAAKDEELSAFKSEKLTEEEKVKAEAEALRKENEEFKAWKANEEVWKSRSSAGSKANWAPGASDAIRAFIEAQDDDERAEAAQAIVTAFAPQTPRGALLGGQGGTPSPKNLDEQIREAEGKAIQSGNSNDWARVNRLKLKKQGVI